MRDHTKMPPQGPHRYNRSAGLRWDRCEAYLVQAQFVNLRSIPVPFAGCGFGSVNQIETALIGFAAGHLARCAALILVASPNHRSQLRRYNS